MSHQRWGYRFLTVSTFGALLLIQSSAFEVSCGNWTENPIAGTCLKFINSPHSFADGRKFCQKLGGDIVKILDSTMNNEIAKRIKKEGSITYYIGLKSDRRHSPYIWVQDSSQLTYQNFYQRLPNQVGQMCAYMSGVVQWGRWYYTPCILLTRVICERGKSVCPSGWIPNTYGGSCISLQLRNVQWHKAREACQNYGADLVVILDAAMNRFIADQLTPSETYWTGLNAQTKNGELRWLESGERINYSTLATGELPSTELCFTISVLDDRTIEWHRKACYKRTQFICEKFTDCTNGKYGRNCSLTCNDGCAGPYKNCDARSGYCTEGCVAGYLGLRCDRECDAGRYGIGCSQNCSSNCRGDDRLCQSHDGRCLLGCVPGFHGKMCEIGPECDAGRYGIGCSQNCSSNCRGDDRLCDSHDGRCLFGCVPGFHGKMCEIECTPGTYGVNCAKTCNKLCSGHNHACSTVSGECLAGCQQGYHGAFCDKEAAPSDVDFYTLLTILAIAPICLCILMFALSMYYRTDLWKDEPNNEKNSPSPKENSSNDSGKSLSSGSSSTASSSGSVSSEESAIN